MENFIGLILIRFIFCKKSLMGLSMFFILLFRFLFVFEMSFIGVFIVLFFISLG